MGKAISLARKRKKGSVDFRYEVALQGFKVGEKVTLEIWEVDEAEDYRKHGERKIGQIEGTVAQPDAKSTKQILKGGVSGTPPKKAGYLVLVTDQDGGSPKEHRFTPVAPDDADEGDSWEIQVRDKADAKVRSATWYLGRYNRQVPKSKAIYRWHGKNNVTFYNDGSTDQAGSAGFFNDLGKALADAKHFIFIADWSFHPYALLKPGGTHIGKILKDWATAHSNGLVAIHTWDHTNIAAADSQNDNAEAIFKDEIGKPANLLWRASSRTGMDGGSGFGWSHHQKFVVLDAPCPGDTKGRRTIKLFIGGLDITQGRFDWPEHPYLPTDTDSVNFRKVTHTRKQKIGGSHPRTINTPIHDWYSAEFGGTGPVLNSGATEVLADDDKVWPRQPWHDIHCEVVGPTAWDGVREFVGRWNLDPSSSDAMGDDSSSDINMVLNKFKDVLFDGKKFVQQWEPRPAAGKWVGQILRSITRDHWGSDKTVKTPAKHSKKRTEFTWRIGDAKKERSIQDAYLRVIGQAERFVYIETQYFIGSGSKWMHEKRASVANGVPEALTKRILEKASLKEDFHVYLIIPMFPEGDPASSAAQAQRDFQWQSMESIIRAVAGAGHNWKDYLTIGFLANWINLSSVTNSGSRFAKVTKNRRYMIYVHSKMMIVDDRWITVGSANLNERSLAGGRDSEISVALWPSITKQDECVKELRDLRKRLFTEHFGSPPSGWETPEVKSCRDAVQKIGADNWDLLTAGKTGAGGKTKKGHFVAWPIDGSKDGLGFRAVNSLIFDGLTGMLTGDDWYWWPTSYAGLGNIPE